MKRRRFLAPEVVQSSARDCGPAGLKCLLEGFGISASYGRLREACQTDVDGTSIDTLEQIAVQLGLDAEQIMLPLDHVLLAASNALPSIVVVQLAIGVTHFVVAWRRHGPLLQLMDPAVGRRWVTAERFREQVYLHTASVPADGWREWAGSVAFLKVLRQRMSNLGLARGSVRELVESALKDLSWRSIASLDAATRMTQSMVSAGGLRRGREATGVLRRFSEDSQQIPENYWCVRPGPPDEDGSETLRFRGAVLLRVNGVAKTAEQAAAANALPRELAAALKEAPARPGLELFRLLRADGFMKPSALTIAILLATGGVIVEALLLRGIFDLGRELGTAGQRIAAMAAFIIFSLALLLLEFPLADGLLRIGRCLELRLRLAFLQKIPLLGDRYFQSRLTSDMAERSHSIHQIRHLAELGGQLMRSTFELLMTTAGIIWLDPASAPWAIASASCALLLPLVAQPPLMERDLRVRSHLGALSRFYLDALLGLVAIRAHGAERSVRREHEGLLLEWARAGFGLQRIAVSVDALQFLCGFGLAAALLLTHIGRGVDPAGVLLLAYWALNLPVLGQDIALVAWQYPAYRNLTLRLLEPLGAPTQDVAPAEGVAQATGPAEVALEHVTVHAAGHTILEDVTTKIAAGSHIAIVGPSGAGKSSLVGLFLGWHRPASGRVLIDDQELDEARLHTLRSEIAWVDPAVQLWNRTFVENLSYGADPNAPLPIATAIDAADLHGVLEKLPDGLQTSLGESGALVSGGEGQRVRLGRALLRTGVRLVILDEPFRGLGREQRRELLARARRLWKDATLICITHDVAETRSFPRVLVIDGGKLVEDGVPAELAAKPNSRYREMLDADRLVREGLWSDSNWRRIWLEDGITNEKPKDRRGATWAAS